MSDYWKDFTIVNEKEKNLGGNLKHGDTNSITPGLWSYLVDRFSVRSVLDIGSGEGHAVNFFHRLGIIAHGFDGLEDNVYQAKFPIAHHDLSTGPYLFPCDMTYCVELVEHIPDEFVPNLIKTMTNAPVIVMTHGLPGQPGHNHVNNQPPKYWIELLNENGFSLSRDNEFFRSIAKKENPQSYFSLSGLIFLKR